MNKTRHATSLLLVLALLLATTPAPATVLTWNGSLVSENWDASVGPATNWTSSLIPGPADDVVFSNAAIDFVVNLNGDREVISVTFSGGSGYSIDDSSAQQTLTLSSGDITASGSTTHTIGSNADIALGADGTWDVASPTTLQIDGNISGNFTLTKTGSGVLVLNAQNTHDGTLIKGGVLEIGHQNRIGGSGAPLQLANNSELRAIANLTVPGNRLLFLDGGGTINTNGNDVSWAGSVNGTGTLTKTGGGILTLNSQNAHGHTRIEGGVLEIGNANRIGRDGGNLTLVNNSELRATGNLTPASNRELFLESGGTVNTNGNSITWAGVVSGTGGLTKTEAGTLTLIAANTYNGGTTINGGTLSLGNSASAGTGAISVLGSTIDYADTINVANAIDLQNDATLNVSSGSATQSGVIGETSGSWGINKTGSGTLTLSANNSHSGTRIEGGVLEIGNANRIGAAGTDLTLANDSELRATGDLTPNASRELILESGGQVNTNGNSITWAGVVSGTGAFTKTGAGTLTLTGTNTYSGGTTIDGGTLQIGNVNTTGSIAGDVALNNGASLAFFHSTGLSYSGVVSGTGSLTKQGLSVLTLTGNNTYSGDTIVDLGTLQIGNGGTTGSIAGDVALNGGTALAFNRSDDLTYSGVVSGGGILRKQGLGTLTLTGNNTYSGDTIVDLGTLQIGNGGTTGSIAGDVALNGGTVLAFNRSDDLTYDGAVIGAGSLTKQGLGTLTLTGANTYSNGTTINEGTLQIGNGGTTGSIAGDVALNNGTAMVFSRSDDLTYSGVVSGGGILRKQGLGTLTLTGNNTYSGDTLVDLGTLQIGNGGTTGSIAGDVALNGGTALVFSRSDDLTYSGVVSGGGSLTKQGLGTLTLTGTNAYTGGTTIDDGTLAISADNNIAAGSTISLDGGLLGIAGMALADEGDITNSINFTSNGGGFDIIEAAHTFTYNAALTHAGPLLKTGPGTLVLTNTGNTYNGGTTISAGTLEISANGQLGSGTISGAGSLLKTGGGTLTLTGNNTYSEGTFISDGTLSISSDGNLGAADGAVTFQGGTLRLDNPTGLDSPDSRAFVTDGADAVFEKAGIGFILRGGISGDGSLVVNGSVEGSVPLVLSDTPSTYSGSTTVNSRLAIFSNEMLPDSTHVIANATISLHFGTTETIGSLSGAGRVLFIGTGNHLTVGQDNTDTLFSGDIDELSGSFHRGALTKIGTGTLTLSGKNTYREGTTVSAGTLLANNTTGSATGSGAVTVNSGGTLGGTGSVAGAVTVNSGGSLGAGASVGQLTVGSVQLDSGSQFTVELAGSGGVAGTDFDQLIVAGSATLGGLLDVSLISPFTPSFGQSFEIVDVAGSLTGTFSGLSQGALVGNFGGTDLFIDYTSGDGNDISLVATQTGDFDFDFNVDGFDFLKWQRGFGDIYDGADLADWEDNFGTAAPLVAASAAVPEPSAAILLLVGGFFFAFGGRRW